MILVPKFSEEPKRREKRSTVTLCEVEKDVLNIICLWRIDKGYSLSFSHFMRQMFEVALIGKSALAIPNESEFNIYKQKYENKKTVNHE